MRDTHEYRFSSTNPLLLWRARTLFTKEPETLEWIRGFSAGDVFFDIGANVGTYSIYAANHCGQVYAFEPESANYAVLNRNIRLNDVAGRVRAFPLAISESRRLDSLRLQSTKAGAALHVFGHNLDFKSDSFTPAFEQGAIALSLDELVFDLGLTVPTHLKIDVDGLEAAVLAGAPRVLAHPTLRSVLVEINESQAADLALVDLLVSFGFRVARKGELVVDGTGRARMVNYVFFRD